MSNRNKILERILNLRELSASSTSEAEAMQAMKLADKMMNSYHVEEAELALAEGMGEIVIDVVNETCDHDFLKVGRNRHKVASVIWSIESYCEVECTTNSYYGTYRVFGDKPDVEMFHYLVALVKEAMDREYANWKRTQQGVGRGAKAAFQLAMGDRIGQRLRDMKRKRATERKQAEEEAAKLLSVDASEVRMAVNNGDLRALNGSTALVVASIAEQKRKAVDEAYRSYYKDTKLGTASGFGYRSGGSAASAGRAAGSSLGLGRPVGGAPVARIG